MGLMEGLNNLTNQLNNVANKITGSNTQCNVINAGGDTSGLGNINLDNANGTLESPAAFLNKHDSSVVMMETNMHNFVDTSAYSRSLREMLGKLPNFSILDCEDGLRQQLNNNNMFYTQVINTGNYCVIPCLSINEVEDIMSSLLNTQVTINNAVKVIICYINYNQNIINTAKNLGIELIGINEIMEINTDATSKLPDMNFGAKQNTLKAAIGRALKSINSANSANGSNLQAGIGGIAATVESSLNGLGEKVSNLFSGNTQGQQMTTNTNTNGNNIIGNELASQIDVQPINETPKAQDLGVSLKKEGE